MKRLVFLGLCAAALVSAADLSVVRNVYILRMSKGLDQYLANHLTKEHVFQVVTDPKLADAVLTDQIGESFEAKFAELYPPPESEKPKPEKDEDAEDAPAAGLLGDTVNKLSNPASNSSFGRAKGMVFLVDARSKHVIWSSYELPKDGTSKHLDSAAAQIVDRIRRELKKK